MKNDINRISTWISDYFAVVGRTNAIVGISGGIDSAVTASLCVKALGKDRVLGVILPIESDVTDSTDALEVISSLGIDHVTINVENSLNDWHYTIISDPKIYQFISDKVMTNNELMVRANAKARFRMTTLYALSEMADGLVIGTTNKSEAMIGYATKFGDGGVDIEPLMEYYKTEIFEMAEELGIPKSILEKKPSAGLWPGQTDEDEIGMPYSTLDSILRYLDGNSSGSTMSIGAFGGNIEKVKRMIHNNQHKLRTPPHCRRS